jgi:hypothetical protein
MKLEEIPWSVMQASNSWEAEHGIKTLWVHRVSRSNGIAYFHALKSDGTLTLFVAIRLRDNENSWVWSCPKESTAEGLAHFRSMYDAVQKHNHDVRGV